MKKRLSVLSIFILWTALCYGQDGTLDNSFGTSGKVRMTVPGMTNANTWIALQADGKIITAGTYLNGGAGDFVIARFTADGLADNSFGTAGKVLTGFTPGSDDVCQGLAIQSDGKIVAVGYGAISGNNPDLLLVRYNTDGSLDNSFDGDGKVQTDLGRSELGLKLTIQFDGKIVVVGGSNLPGLYEPAIFRYNTDGSLDNTFNGTGHIYFPGSATDDFLLDVAIQSDGKIVACGYEASSPWYHGEVIRLNSNGTPDNSFGTNGLVNISALYPWYTVLYGLTVLSNGKIAVTGASTIAAGTTDLFVARLNANGTTDNSFHGSGYNDRHIGNTDYVIGIKEESNGKLVISGGAEMSNNDYDFLLARFNTDGNFDNTYDVDGVLIVPIGTGVNNDAGGNCVIQTDGKVLMVGRVQNGSDYDFGVIRVQSDIIVLPVLLQSFEAMKNSGQSVLVSWVTGTEQNNKGFEVQRSNDGIHFSVIGWVNGKGHSSITQHYTFDDAAPLKGNNFYRLKQFDMDGRSTFSAIRKINFEIPPDFTIYPNPVKSAATIYVNKNMLLIKLTDVNGRELWRSENSKPGTITIPMQQLAAGLYIIQVINGNGEKSAQKIIKQ